MVLCIGNRKGWGAEDKLRLKTKVVYEAGTLSNVRFSVMNARLSFFPGRPFTACNYGVHSSKLYSVGTVFAMHEQMQLTVHSVISIRCIYYLFIHPSRMVSYNTYCGLAANGVG